MKFPFFEVTLMLIGVVGMIYLAIKEFPRKKKNKNTN